MANGTVRVAPRRYRVLQLESFRDGVVRGVDSPIHHPHRVEITVADLAPQGAGGTTARAS